MKAFSGNFNNNLILGIGILTGITLVLGPFLASISGITVLDAISLGIEDEPQLHLEFVTSSIIKTLELIGL